MNKKGFTAIELVVTIFIFLVGIVGAFGVITYQLRDIKVSNNRTIALYLGQEGVEIIKNIRDTNLIKSMSDPSVSWYDGLDAGCYEKDYTGFSFSRACEPCNSFSELRVHTPYGYRHYITGIQVVKSVFKRKIEVQNDIDTEGNDYKKITVTVCWENNGKHYQAVVMDNIYGYWNP